ncbi:MAG TPA: hypothetical protein VD963_00810 [Phycisphaerales bacterium]|nr:hypothetical protein [Phycisphaerales bacterium]
MPARHSRPRGMVLLVVLLALVVGALAASGAAYVADAQRGAARTSARLAQSRALAWSGVQAVMAELAEQRSELLRGGEPTIRASWTLPEPDGHAGPARVFRAVPVRGRLVQSEPAKLDLNAATGPMLAQLGPLGEGRAARVVAGRAAGRLTSTEELCAVAGLERAQFARARGAPDEAADAAPGRAPALCDLVTVFAFDPAVQAGAADPTATGQPRLRLEPEVLESVGRALEDALGAEAAPAVPALLKQLGAVTTPGQLARLLAGQGVDQKLWPLILDLLAVPADPFAAGRVDVLRAPVAVLACIPGIDAEGAQRLVRVRDGLDERARTTPAWLVLEKVITPEQFVEAADFVTCRSLQWRVVVEGGFQAARPTGEPPDAAGETPLTDRVVLEAVIDVAAPRPRVAYLRDITLMPIAERLEEEARQRRLAGRAEIEEEPEAATEADAESDTPAADGRPFEDSFAFDPVEGPRRGAWRLDLGAEPRADRSAADGSAADGWAIDEPGVRAPPPEPARGPERAPPADTRLGRWTSGAGGRR